MKDNWLIILSGLCGAGKSTKARELCNQYWNENRRRPTIVSMDDLVRQYPSATAEHLTMELVGAASYYLLFGCDVIVDACNLHHHDKLRWETVAKALQVTRFEWIHLDTDVNECIKRDARRSEPVGKERILEMAHEYSATSV